MDGKVRIISTAAVDIIDYLSHDGIKGINNITIHLKLNTGLHLFLSFNILTDLNANLCMHYLHRYLHENE